MRNLTITIALRILLIISFALHIFPQVKSNQLTNMLWNKQISYDFYVENDIHSIYYSMPFWILILVNAWFTYYNSKKRNNGRILMKEIVIPEMNLDNDERESVITGKSAKAAFSVIIVFSFFMLSLFPLATHFFNDPLYYSLITIAVLPITGLLTYFISYNVLYSR